MVQRDTGVDFTKQFDSLKRFDQSLFCPMKLFLLFLFNNSVHLDLVRITSCICCEISPSATKEALTTKIKKIHLGPSYSKSLTT